MTRKNARGYELSEQGQAYVDWLKSQPEEVNDELETLYQALSTAGKTLLARSHDDDQTYQAAYAEVVEIRRKIAALESPEVKP